IFDDVPGPAAEVEQFAHSALALAVLGKRGDVDRGGPESGSILGQPGAALDLLLEAIDLQLKGDPLVLLGGRLQAHLIQGKDAIEGKDVEGGPARLALTKQFLAAAIASDDESTGKPLQRWRLLERREQRQFQVLFRAQMNVTVVDFQSCSWIFDDIRHR